MNRYSKPFPNTNAFAKMFCILIINTILNYIILGRAKKIFVSGKLVYSKIRD